jgi:hypothetical protein
LTDYLIELPTHLVAHLQNRSSQPASQVLQKSHQAKPRKKEILKIPHRTTERQMSVGKIGHTNH